MVFIIWFNLCDLHLIFMYCQHAMHTVLVNWKTLKYSTVHQTKAVQWSAMQLVTWIVLVTVWREQLASRGIPYCNEEQEKRASQLFDVRVWRSVDGIEYVTSCDCCMATVCLMNSYFLTLMLLEFSYSVSVMSQWNVCRNAQLENSVAVAKGVRSGEPLAHSGRKQQR